MDIFLHIQRVVVTMPTTCCGVNWTVIHSVPPGQYKDQLDMCTFPPSENKVPMVASRMLDKRVSVLARFHGGGNISHHSTAQVKQSTNVSIVLGC